MSTFGKIFDLLVLSSGGNFGREVGRPLRFDAPCDTVIGIIGLRSSKDDWLDSPIGWLAITGFNNNGGNFVDGLSGSNDAVVEGRSWEGPSGEIKQLCCWLLHESRTDVAAWLFLLIWLASSLILLGPPFAVSSLTLAWFWMRRKEFFYKKIWCLKINRNVFAVNIGAIAL